MAVRRVNDSLLGPLERVGLAWMASRLPAWVVPDHLTFVGLIGALTSDFDAGHRIPGFHDRANDAFNGVGQRRHAVPDRPPQMILHGDAAYLCEALVDLQVTAVGREAGKANRRRVVD